MLVALLVCLIPTTIGGLLSAIGIAGMDRMIQRNVIAMSGRAVEAAGDVDVLLLDKTGTITLGNRQAVEFIPVGKVTPRRTGRSRPACLAGRRNARRPQHRGAGQGKVWPARAHAWARRPREARRPGMHFVPFTAQTRMSGVDVDGTAHPQGRPRHHDRADAEPVASPSHPTCNRRSRASPAAAARPWWWRATAKRWASSTSRTSSKAASRNALRQLRKMGIKTVMITGDNPLTAAAIAAEAGVDDFLAQATPEAKLKLIRDYQTGGRLVAMTGDGTNDAPALAQADVAVAMNTGTQPAREAANMVDLDSNPTKLIEIVEIGKQLLMTRGALTTFSIANDVSKYFAIIPAAFASTYPVLSALNYHAPDHARRAPSCRR